MPIPVWETIRTTDVVLSMQKVVIKVSMHCQKCRVKALKIVCAVHGIESIALRGEEQNQLEVLGSSFDAVLLVQLLRKKVGHAHLISIGPPRWPNDRSQRIGNSSTNGELRKPWLHLPSLRLERLLKAKDFRQYYFPSKDLTKLLELPVLKRRAPLLLNFIPTYKSTLPDVPRRKKKSLSPPTATTQTASTSRTDQGSTSEPTDIPADIPSTSAPYLVPIPERKRRRRLVKTAEMVRPKPVAKNLLADLPANVDAAPTQPMPPQKPKRIKKAQPKTKAADVEAEDEVPISILAESKKAASTSSKRPAEAQPSETTQSKRPRSSSATTSGSRIPKVPWRPEITLEDKPVFANDSADDVNVGVALSTAVLLPGDLDRNAQMSEFENYALMLQHSVQAMQHAHSFSVQSFKNREELADTKREVATLQKTNKGLQTKMKKLEDQAEAAVKAQNKAEEKADAAEAIKKVAEAERREAEEKMAQAEKELLEALATKEAEIKEADEKAYAQGMADVTGEYELQVKQAFNKGFTLGWMSLLKKLDVPEDSPLRKADAIPLPFPPPPPADSEEDSEADVVADDVDGDEEEALVRKPKDAEVAKSPSLNEQVLDLTQEDEGDEVPKETVLEVPSSDAFLFGRTITETISEIDAEIAAEKEAEVPVQQTSDVQAQSSANVEES